MVASAVLGLMLEPVTDSTGRTVGLASPGAPWLADLIRKHAADVAAERARAAAIRAGALKPAPPSERWLISDRH
jgi:hypothetical protein